MLLLLFFFLFFGFVFGLLISLIIVINVVVINLVIIVNLISIINLVSEVIISMLMAKSDDRDEYGGLNRGTNLKRLDMLMQMQLLRGLAYSV